MPVVNELGIWKSHHHSYHTRDAKEKLANIIGDKSNPARKVAWCAEGEGVALLGKALKSVTAELSNYVFRLVDPVANTPSLLGVLKEKNARFGFTGAVTYTGNRVSLIALFSHKATLYERVDRVLKNMVLDEQILELDHWGVKKLNTMSKPNTVKPMMNKKI